MKITLFNPSRTLSSDGSRLISALLKRAGHSVKSVFLSRSASLMYELDELRQLNDILCDTDLAMIAVYSSYTHRAIQITDFIHSEYPGMQVIWGGPHCISVPELSLRHADGVCYSEGDQAIIEFVNKVEAKIDYFNTPNMAFMKNGSYLKNDSLPPFADLDSLPFYDFELDDHFLLDNGLFPMTKEIVQKRHAYYPYNIPTFFYQTSRGCPNKCTYCNNSRYIKIFGHNPLRFISVDRVVHELEHTLKHLDFFELLCFGDDDFLMRPQNQLEEFAEKYKKKIDLPFIIAASANTYRKEKTELLLDAGLKCIQMGVQSGSQKVLDDVFKRKVSVKKTKEVINQIEPYQKTHDLDLLLDFIIDNPYESRDDVFQTYNYLVDLSPKTIVNIFYLAFFPGTPLYEKALEDGFIEPYREKTDTFKFSTREGIRIRYQKNYELLLILLLRLLRLRTIGHQSPWHKYFPKFVFRVMASKLVRAFASLFPESFYVYLCQKINK